MCFTDHQFFESCNCNCQSVTVTDIPIYSDGENGNKWELYLCLTSNMYSHMRSLSAPELYVRSTETLTKTTNLTPNDANYSYSSGVGPSTDSRQQVKAQPEHSPDREKRKFILHRPCRIAFLSYVYVLLGSQVFLSALQWLGSTYRWRPHLNTAERSLYMLLLFLTWLNLSLAFFGFRRLQISHPFNWIVFVCMFESLTLLVMCLCLRELDLAWYFILIAISVILLYTPLGLWIPPKLTANIWILILMAMSVLITTMVSLVSGVCMRFYMLMTACLIFFGPWTTYNAFKLHSVAEDMTCRFKYLEHAAKMFITYGCTVGGLVIVSRIAIETIESENCKSRIFCNTLGVT
ncbi:uncharacterized protein LOC127565226 [Drosophila albomicans]|uniref:Uncharacterized protein LOC127565226 n=1 Tax=Drosophila albomicans TaxID=7291 RepID=A0A9C6SMJ3_DROAB|nr:uncharacterized protein LOC127565226 [Drosophila albomicans]